MRTYEFKLLNEDTMIAFAGATPMYTREEADDIPKSLRDTFSPWACCILACVFIESPSELLATRGVRWSWRLTAVRGSLRMWNASDNVVGMLIVPFISLYIGITRKGE